MARVIRSNAAEKYGDMIQFYLYHKSQHEKADIKSIYCFHSAWRVIGMNEGTIVSKNKL